MANSSDCSSSRLRSSFIPAKPDTITPSQLTRFLFPGGTDNQLPEAPIDPMREHEHASRKGSSHSHETRRLDTEGIAPMDRPGLFARFFMSVVRCAERLNLRYAKHGNPSVYDNALFPWVADIERDWMDIRTELDRVLLRRSELPNIQDITADAKSITEDSGWKIFLLVAYGIESKLNISLCPKTWRIVQRIPGLKTAMFSIFQPGKRLPPHRGPYNGVLRLHLGLLVPDHDGNLGIRIGSEQRTWSEGQVLIFDDAYDHEAWNETDMPRVVLFVDFERPLRFPANLVNKALLKLALLTPYMREGDDNLRRWERSFYR